MTNEVEYMKNDQLPLLTWNRPMIALEAAHYLSTIGFVAAELYKSTVYSRDKLRVENARLDRLVVDMALEMEDLLTQKRNLLDSCASLSIKVDMYKAGFKDK